MEQVDIYARAKMEKENGIGSNSGISDRARRIVEDRTVVSEF
jgi:hypothetical protein